MRKATAALALCLLLSGCSMDGEGGGTKEAALEIRAKYLAAEELTAVAAVTADYGERLYSFRLRYTGSEDEGAVEVLEPENIAGVTVALRDGETAVGCGGEYLETGELSGGLSPLEAIPALLASWRGGYIEDCGGEKLDGVNAVAVTVDATKAGGEAAVRHRTWFDVVTRLPIRAEISVDGQTVIYCDFGDVALR